MVRIICPHCNRVIQENIDDIEKQRYFQCLYCGATLSNKYFKDDDNKNKSYIG